MPKPKLSKEERGALTTVKTMLETGLIKDGRRSVLGEFFGSAIMSGKRLFRMDYPAFRLSDGGRCGTVCCIGGWMGVMMGMDINEADSFVNSYANRGKFNDLFFPQDGMKKITPVIAAKAIDNFLRTGNPRWGALV